MAPPAHTEGIHHFLHTCPRPDFGRSGVYKFALLRSRPQQGPTFAVATYKTKALNTTGTLRGTGDPNLDGEVTDSFDLIGRLANSTRVRQSIIRHAFRYFMGRNEMLSDSQTLIDADQAYVLSGGSFKAVIISLLTSDSFLYRK